MKLTELLIMTCCLIIVAQSETVREDQEALLKRASEQLERLVPYRRIANLEAPDLSELEAWRFPINQNDLDETRNNADRQDTPWKVVEIMPEKSREESDAAKPTIDDEKRITIDIITDPKYAAMMQERIKRGFDAGSAGLITSIAGGVLSGVASASSGSAAQASASSSQNAHKPVYGPPQVYSYGEKPFGPWDFKTAIFGTLFQALKAIGGGVLALKGQLVKGGGYLLSAKAGVISKTGDAITSFGKHIASSVATPPKSYPPETYPYNPPIENIGYDSNYQGQPPHADDYTDANDYSPHSTYHAPSDDNDQGGLLIVTPTKSDLNEHAEQLANTAAPPEKPDLTKLEESFGGPATGSVIKDFFNSVPHGSGGDLLKDHQALGQDHISYNIDNNNNNVESYSSHLQHPGHTYGTPNYPSNNPAQSYENYSAGQNGLYQQPEPPQTTSSHLHQPHHFPGGHLSIQPSVEYPPFHVQHFEYPPHPNPNALTDPSLLKPHHDDDGMSVYASLTVDTEPQLTHSKIPPVYPGLYDPPRLHPHTNFHGQHQFAQSLFHSDLDSPLRIHLLNQVSPTHYWQGHGTLTPASALGSFNPFRKRDVLQRRTFASRLARYSLRPMRPHRL